MLVLWQAGQFGCPAFHCPVPDRSRFFSTSGYLASSAVFYLPCASCAGESLFSAGCGSVRSWKQTISCGGLCLKRRCGRPFSESASSSASAIHSVVVQLVQPSLLTSFLFGHHAERASLVPSPFCDLRPKFLYFCIPAKSRG